MERIKMEQSASMEDYLEAVAMLRSRGRAVRVKEISQALGVKMPSVTAALRKLSEEGLVEHERYGRVKLTPAGERTAKDVFHRHEVLRRFLADILHIDPATALEDACRMEHSISPATLERLSNFLAFAEAGTEDKSPWLTDYQYYLQHGELPPERPTKRARSRKQG
jgi:DtxR family Mn-dependent transcriptional regulator